MTSKTLTNLPADDLAAELARRETEAQREATERAQRLADARKTWAEQTWTRREQSEADLIERGREAREAFTAAVKVADLPGAFEAWMIERASRYARESLRNRIVSAGRELGERVDNIAELRWYTPDFLARLEEEADKHARDNGYDLTDELVPDVPTEVQ